MTSRRISRTEYRVPGSGLPRLGATTHAESGVDLEEYLRPLEQVHTSAHGSGVVEGLTVTAVPGASVVRITPGVAIDGAGRHIALAAGGFAEISPDPDNTSNLLPVDATGVELPTGGRSGSCEVSVAWRETFDQDLFASSGQKIFQDNHTPWLRLSPVGGAPDDGIVLATANLDNAGAVLPDGLTAAGRSGPAPAMSGIRLCAPTATAGAPGLSVSDRPVGQLRAGPAGEVQLQVTDPATHVELIAEQGTFAKMSVAADRLALRRADGSEPIVLDPATARLGVGTDAPSHPLHVADPRGIRQNALYLGGATGWSSLTYNAHHNDGNTDWVFPDPSHSAVTVEMDDNGGTPRFQIWSTTGADTRAWQLRLAVDGNTGKVTVPADLAVGGGGNFSGVLSVHTTTPNPNLVGSLNATAETGTAVCATTRSGTAISALGSGGNSVGVWASGTPAGQFVGDVSVTGTLTAGAKQFVIDHPLDPDNRLLTHASVEAAERLVVYSGNVTCDEDGAATVRLPSWLEALATDFRYQLTCVGGYAQVYVSREVRDNTFEIAGGRPGLTVSWQLTGVRHDPWAQRHDLVVEEDKPDRERGYYQHPEAFGKTMSASVHWARNEELVQAHPVLARQAVRHHDDHEARRSQAQEDARRQAQSEGS